MRVIGYIDGMNFYEASKRQALVSCRVVQLDADLDAYCPGADISVRYFTTLYRPRRGADGRRLEMELEAQAAQFCQGILLGLFRVRDGGENDILNWVPHFPGEAAANALKCGGETGGPNGLVRPQGSAAGLRQRSYESICRIGLASQARP